MGTIYRTLKIRIYPNKKQQELIIKSFGCARFAFNNMLAERIEVYEKLKDDRRALFDYKYKNEVELKKEYPWMKEVSKFVI